MDLERSREILLQHSRSEKNGKLPAQFTHEKKMTNPICGDHVHLQVRAEGDHIVEVGFSAKACAICSASTSLMTDLIRGKTFLEAEDFAVQFEESILAPQTEDWPFVIRQLKSFEHLKVNPSRRACAILPWIALKLALKETPS